MSMPKHSGRMRAHKLLARAGYGKGGAKAASEGVHSHSGIASELAKVEGETHAKGHVPKGRLDRKPRASGGGIHIKKSHKGLLHKDLGVASGKKIPEKKLESAKHSGDPAVRKRAVFALNAKGWKH